MKPLKRLPIIRKELNLTQAELSRLTGIPQETISRIENKQRALTIQQAASVRMLLALAEQGLLAGYMAGME